MSSTTTLSNCPIGLFLFNGALCLKTEYGSNDGRIDAYIVESGEFFWGGTSRPPEQRALQVSPVPLPQSSPQSSSSTEYEQAFILVEKRLCSILGRPWTPTGFSIDTLLNDLDTLVRGRAQEDSQ